MNNLIYTTLRLFRIYVSPGPQEIPGAVYRVLYQTAVPNYRLGVRWTAARVPVSGCGRCRSPRPRAGPAVPERRGRHPAHPGPAPNNAAPEPWCRRAHACLRCHHRRSKRPCGSRELSRRAFGNARRGSRNLPKPIHQSHESRSLSRSRPNPCLHGQCQSSLSPHWVLSTFASRPLKGSRSAGFRAHEKSTKAAAISHAYLNLRFTVLTARLLHSAFSSP